MKDTKKEDTHGAISFMDIEFVRKIKNSTKTRTTRKPCNCEKHHGTHYQKLQFVKAMYKIRSTHKQFCECHGLPLISCPNYQKHHEVKAFNKHFATLQITEIETIAMGKTQDNEYYIIKDGQRLTQRELEDFAVEDGFNTPQSLFCWFDAHYGLETPKIFNSYLFKVIGTTIDEVKQLCPL